MKQTLKNHWLKAAVIGSIWAAVEIIAGSFLHNLRVPFAGTLLAASSVFLLTAFMRRWKEPYIILRAGIICALMKSVSPSAVILGPMAGIFAEALILEFTALLLGRNIFAFMAGGALAVLWPLLQKVLNWLILYGFDLVKILESLYDFLVMKTGAAAPEPWVLISAIVLLYMLVGALSALGGLRAASGVIRSKSGRAAFPKSDFERKTFFKASGKQNYSLWMLSLIIVWIVGTLYLLNLELYYAALLSGAGFTTLMLVRYKQSVRHLKKPMIWIQFALITLVSAFLWEWAAGKSGFSLAGLRAGLEMNFRALIIIFGFAGISTELRNPLLKSLLFNRGFASLYRALSLAFSALPLVVASLPQIKNLYAQRQEILSRVFDQADEMLLYFSEKLKAREHIMVLTGEVHEGKTGAARYLSDCLKTKGFDVQGILSPGVFENGERVSFESENIKTGEKKPLAVRHKSKRRFPFGRYRFNAETLKHDNRLIRDICKSQADLLIIDEIGPLELAEKGRFKGLNTAIKQKDLLQLWIIRKNKLNEASAKWQLASGNIWNIHKQKPSEICREIEKKLRNGTQTKEDAGKV